MHFTLKNYPKAGVHVIVGVTTLLSRQKKNKEKSHKVPNTHTHTHTHTQRHILPSFCRPVLALYVLRPASAGGLINWPFHLVDVHCVSGFVCIRFCERTLVCACVCVRVCLGTLSELWSVWLPHWRLLSQPLKACNRRPFCWNECTSIHQRENVAFQKDLG